MNTTTDHTQKRLLVTGGAGFIGTNFIRRILALRPEWEIVNLDALTYAGNPGNFDGLEPNMKSRYTLVHGDIRDTELLNRVFTRYGFESIIHFAAESHVDRAILGPESFLDTNVTGTFRLLEASLKHWKDAGKPEAFRFLHISTDEVYGSLGPEGYFTENTPFAPNSPYSASKAASDHFVRAYCQTYGFPAIVTHCSNNYGPYQFPEKLIPLIIINIVDKKPLPVYGDGKNVRDWLYVIDHCEALLRVLDSGRPGETYNIGGGYEMENIAIVNRLCKILNNRLNLSGHEASQNLIKFVADRPGHDRRYAIDAAKILNELGWKPRFEFNQALEATVDWYLSHKDWLDSVRSGAYRKWIELNYHKRG